MGVEHVPRVAPGATLQIPPQQSRGLEQTSPVWVQNEEPRSHLPLLQSFEQHSPLLVHAFPDVRQVPLSGWQAPFVHLPPQQAPSLVQVPLSATQVLDEQTPLLQTRLQQSVLAEQLAPAGAHLPTDDAQAWVVGSQRAEQHSPFAVQD
jgi:hypothetical protein